MFDLVVNSSTAKYLIPNKFAGTLHPNFMSAYLDPAGLPWVWGFPWVWVWDGYGDVVESP